MDANGGQPGSTAGPNDRSVLARQLDELVERAHAGRRVLAAVYGDAGHGKSTLLHALSRNSERLGQQTIWLRGAAPDKDIPYAGVHNLISGNTHLLQGLEGPAARLLRRVLTDFRPPDSPLTMCSAVTEWLDCLAPDRPLLVAVDDADLVDEDSLRTLAFVASRQRPAPLALVLAATHKIPILDRVASEVIRLEDIPPATATDLVASRGVDAPTSRVVVTRLGGNPLALNHVADLVATRQLTVDPDEPLPVPERMHRDIDDRTGGAEQPVHDLLEAAAVTHETSCEQLSTWCARTGAGHLDQLLRSAERGRLIETDGHAIFWRRPWIAEALASRCPQPTRLRLRREVGAPPHNPRATAGALDRLTASERRVAVAVVQGATTRQTASQLNLSEKTIEAHLHNIYRKLDVQSRSQLGVALLPVIDGRSGCD